MSMGFLAFIGIVVVFPAVYVLVTGLWNAVFDALRMVLRMFK